MHDFKPMLRESNTIALMEIITKIYQHYFGESVIMQLNDHDIEAQKRGVDRKIITPEGDRYYVEEKVRPPRRNGRIYQDILLEYLSSKEHDTQGWVCKPLKAHWLLYINLPHQHAYLLPVFLLQDAWKMNRQQWMSDSRKKEAKNTGYTTVSAAVSVNELFAAMTQSAERYSVGQLFRDIAGTFIYPFELTARDKLDLMSIKRECLVTV